MSQTVTTPTVSQPPSLEQELEMFRGEGSPAAAAMDTIATLPKGARIVSTAVAGERLVLTLDIGGVTEIRTFDAKTLKPAGKLKFVSEP